ncbi:gram domain containing [Trichoderma cornu-damae]|uniref:Gram domain containing n=1 Tax=Trichoderma cornu-damae TaxID=654480 RepID=A0A9P8QM93_9HYPO|nr:gram domain containing [Trichoderma cornu-damae]
MRRTRMHQAARANTNPLDTATMRHASATADDDKDDGDDGDLDNRSFARSTTAAPRAGHLASSSPVVQVTDLDPQTDRRPSLLSRRLRRGSSRSPSPNASKEALSEIAQLPEPPAAAKTTAFSPEKHSILPPSRIATLPARASTADDLFGPVIVNTPPTPVERTNPITLHLERKLPPVISELASNGDGTSSSSSSGIGTHRRTKSGSASAGPSKLSNITPAPLPPTPESGQVQTPSSAGFFSSMFSVAQNAASTISSNIQGGSLSIGGNASRANLAPKPQSSPAAGQADVDRTEPTPSEPQSSRLMDKKESATKTTIGTGELSLSQLGIMEPPAAAAAAPETSRFPDLNDTRARSESAPADSQARGGDDALDESLARPRSLYEAANGDQEQGASLSDQADKESGSAKSDTQRKRGGSTATTNTAAPPALAGGGPSATAPKLTGFAIASKKRNRDFHTLFKSVPDDDYLIEDYSCALQREILAHGRLYVSEGHLCFSSNILGWTTTLVMSFDEIVSVEKRSTALVFKNGLMISTLHAKHIFASFTSRDATYDLIVNIWKLGHPTLTSTLNGVRLEGTGGDKTEKLDVEAANLEPETPAGSDSEEGSGDGDDDDDDFYDEEESGHAPEVQATDAVAAGDAGKASRKASGAVAPSAAALEAAVDGQPPSAGAGPFPGPAAHAPTDCGDSETHYDKFLADEVVPAPLGKVFSMLFGEASAEWMGKWITENQKCFDLQMEDKKGLGQDNRSRAFTYIKPLNAPIGPKQTKCIVTETVDSLDFEKAASVSVATQNPDVPSGNIFRVKTRYCLSWAENNATRVQVNCTTEWSGKSWLKGTIEKNVNEGQALYCKDLFAALKAAVSTRPRSSTNGNGAAKPRKKGKKSKALQSPPDTIDAAARAKKEEANWGLFEPARAILEPVVDIVKPILTGNVVYGLLVGLLVATWFGFGRAPGNKSPASLAPDASIYNPYRLAAYDEMWRREDSELWDWLEERVSLERLSVEKSNARRREADPRTLEERLREERMDEREVQEAIRVTEEKLKVLREVMARSKLP